MPDLLDQAIAGLHWRDYGGDGDNMVLVHGLGGSLSNWDAVGPRLAKGNRVIAFDLPGFGYSPPRSDYRVGTHVSAAIDFIEEVGYPVTLMGNSMGGLVAEFVASSRPDLVSRLILVAPATPPRLPDPHLDWPTVIRLTLEATPGVGLLVGQLIKWRYTPEEIVALGLESITHDPARVPPDVVANLEELARERVHYPWAVQALHESAFSVAMTYRRPRDFVRMIRAIEAPTLVIQGKADHIVSPTAVRWLASLRRDWDLIQMDDTGHTPQLDAPVRFTREVEKWLTDRTRPGTGTGGAN